MDKKIVPWASATLFMYVKIKLSFLILLLFCILTNSANIQHCDNLSVRLQRRTTNIQRCSNIDTTFTELQRCSNVFSMAKSKWNSLCTMNILMTTLLQRWNVDVKLLRLHNVATKTSNFHNAAPTLPQRCNLNFNFTTSCRHQY